MAGRHEPRRPAGLETVPLDLALRRVHRARPRRGRPDAVVHAAALADPDRCEREPEAAAALNVGASALLAPPLPARGLRLVALSTDLVFRGTGRPGRRRRPGPLLVYGRTKLAGEEAILAAHPGGGRGPRGARRTDAATARGRRPREAVAWACGRRKRVRLFTDQYRTPDRRRLGGRAPSRLLEGAATGIFHLGGPERVSRYELGVRTARRLGLDAGLIEPVRAAERRWGRPARPTSRSTRAARTRRARAGSPRPLDAAIARSGRL